MSHIRNLITGFWSGNWRSIKHVSLPLAQLLVVQKSVRVDRYIAMKCNDVNYTQYRKLMSVMLSKMFSSYSALYLVQILVIGIHPTWAGVSSFETSSVRPRAELRRLICQLCSLDSLFKFQLEIHQRLLQTWKRCLTMAKRLYNTWRMCSLFVDWNLLALSCFKIPS